MTLIGTPGHRPEAVVFEPLMEQGAVKRPGQGRPQGRHRRGRRSRMRSRRGSRWDRQRPAGCRPAGPIRSRWPAPVCNCRTARAGLWPGRWFWRWRPTRFAVSQRRASRGPARRRLPNYHLRSTCCPLKRRPGRNQPQGGRGPAHHRRLVSRFNQYAAPPRAIAGGQLAAICYP